MTRWLLYGAYGYTGQLIVEEAVKQGHMPTLAGRNAGKLAPLAQQYNLEAIPLDLTDKDKLAEVVPAFDLVLHAAGPFIQTSPPMLRACLNGHTHYLDITGEIPIFQNTFAHHEIAQQRGIALLSGVGFDIVPTDCLGKYVADQLPTAHQLTLAFISSGKLSAGTINSMLELLPTGGLVRRGGRLVSHRFGTGKRKVHFSNGQTRKVIPVPWGDVATAQHTTGIPNVTTYMAFPTIPALPLWTLLGRMVLVFTPMRRLAQTILSHTVQGPDLERRQTRRAYLWAQARDPQGREVEAWLETKEVYQYTAEIAVQAVEQLLANPLKGAWTPASAFGADFALSVAGTKRFDTLP